MVGKRVTTADTSLPERWVAYVDSDLAYLHRQRWNRIAHELRDRIERAQGEERVEIERELARHRSIRFRPETSRAPVLAKIEAGTRERADDRLLASARDGLVARMQQMLETRLLAVRNAVAHQRLEGLEVDRRTVDDLERAARGDIEVRDVIAAIHRRIAHAEI